MQKKKISLNIDNIINRLLEVCGQKPGKQVNLAEDEVDCCWDTKTFYKCASWQWT